MAYPTHTLIDPTAQVIDIRSSTRSIKLIHRALLSHLCSLTKNKGSRMLTTISGESWEIEYNSTAQLAEDIGHLLENRQKPE